MKELLLSALLIGLLNFTRTAAQPQDGLYFTLRGQIYLPGSTVLITDIGSYGGTDPDQPGSALVCVTTNINTACCRGSDGGAVGGWYFPGGNQVPRGAYGGYHISRTGSTHQVRLNRWYDYDAELGAYECRVPDSSGVEHVASVYIISTETAAFIIGALFLSNNTILPSEELSVESQVHCIGSAAHCCSLFPTLNESAREGLIPSGIGSWRYPNGSYVRLTLASDSYGITRQEGQVILHRQGQHMAKGLWRCDVPDEHGKTISYIAGIYQQGGGNLSVMNGVHFSSEVSLNPFKYVIRCVTTGGPATTVTWTKDGSRILYDHQRQAVTSYEDSTYQHEIVLSDSVIAGEYRIDVSNGASSVSSTFCISGVNVLHNGGIVPNNTIVSFEDIPAGSALLCSTDNVNSSAFWRNPQGLQSSTIFSVGHNYSLLVANRTQATVQAYHNGMWHCQIYDTYDMVHYIYVGLFSEGLGVVSVSADIQFTLISSNPPSCSLICVTTGGPATSVQWTRNGVPVGNGGDFTSSKIIVNTATSTYHNVLTVRGKHLGTYNMSVTNSRQISLVQSSYEVTEEAPPTDFSVSLYHDDGIHVSWTPAPTASSSSDYIIYYETSSAVELVLVSGTENSYIIRGLTFGSTYSVSVAARSDFQSPSIGPKKIEIGIPDSPENLIVIADTASAQLSWSSPSEYHGPTTHYEVKYSCVLTNVVNRTNTSARTLTVTGLQPEKQYVFQVRAYTTAGAGVYSSATSATTTALSVVEGLQVSVLDANTVRLSWEPVTVLEWEVAHYTISYTAYHTHLTKSVQHSSTVVPHTRTTEVFLITHTDPKFEHWFTVSVSIQVQGEEFQSEPSEIIFQFDESFFQLRIGPVENCALWESTKAELIKSSIHEAITEAVSELCNCSFPIKLLRQGRFRCWDSPSEVTYRSSVIGVDTSYNSSQILEHMDSWVRSEVSVVDVGCVTLEVLNGACGVGLSCTRREPGSGE